MKLNDAEYVMKAMHALTDQKNVLLNWETLVVAGLLHYNLFSDPLSSPQDVKGSSMWDSLWPAAL